MEVSNCVEQLKSEIEGIPQFLVVHASMSRFSTDMQCPKLRGSNLENNLTYQRQLWEYVEIMEVLPISSNRPGPARSKVSLSQGWRKGTSNECTRSDRLGRLKRKEYQWGTYLAALIFFLSLKFSRPSGVLTSSMLSPMVVRLVLSEADEWSP
jgi:hypothetical protein